MDLLHRYLNAVAIRLPSAERADIVAELRESLLSQIEDRQAELRVLDTDEIVALLRTYGHPFVVASRYRVHRYLVGPELFPFYWLALQIVIGLLALGYLAGAAIAIVVGKSASAVFAWTAQSGWPVSMYLFGVTTFSFVVLDRLGVGRWIAKAWSPRLLPGEAMARGASLLRRIHDWLFAALLLTWGLSAIYWPIIASRAALDEYARSMPVWQPFGISMLAAGLVQFAVHAAAYFGVGTQRALLAGSIAAKGGVLMILTVFFRNMPWFEVTNMPVDLVQRTVWALHFSVGFSLGVLAALALIGLMLEAPRFIQILRR